MMQEQNIIAVDRLNIVAIGVSCHHKALEIVENIPGIE
jgi:hypothetical protein